MSRYKRTYELLKRYGFSPAWALEIIIDGRRGDDYALTWVRAVVAARHS